MSPVKLTCVLLVVPALASCSLLPFGGGSSSASGDGAAIRPVCAPHGADLERAFTGCRPGDVVLAAPPGLEEATILAARVCDFGREVVVQRQSDEATGAGATLACAYAGRVRPVPG
jgi:hypothetical protein